MNRALTEAFGGAFPMPAHLVMYSPERLQKECGVGAFLHDMHCFHREMMV
jgi:hypothetical protein